MSAPVTHCPSCFKSIFQLKANLKLEQTNKTLTVAHEPLISLAGSQDSEQAHFVPGNKKILELALSPQLVKNFLIIKKTFLVEKKKCRREQNGFLPSHRKVRRKKVFP